MLLLGAGRVPFKARGGGALFAADSRLIGRCRFFLNRFHSPRFGQRNVLATQERFKGRNLDAFGFHQERGNFFEIIRVIAQHCAGPVVGLSDDLGDLFIDLLGHRLGVISRFLDIPTEEHQLVLASKRYVALSGSCHSG